MVSLGKREYSAFSLKFKGAKYFSLWFKRDLYIEFSESLNWRVGFSLAFCLPVYILRRICAMVIFERI